MLISECFSFTVFLGKSIYAYGMCHRKWINYKKINKEITNIGNITIFEKTEGILLFRLIAF